MAKKELVPAKQEKAQERIKNFKSELADYRGTLDRLKKDREDAVRNRRSNLAQAHIKQLYAMLDPVLTEAAIAISTEPNRALWPPSAPRSHSRKPLRSSSACTELALRTTQERANALNRRCPSGIHTGASRVSGTKLHDFHKCRIG